MGENRKKNTNFSEKKIILDFCKICHIYRDIYTFQASDFIVHFCDCICISGRREPANFFALFYMSTFFVDGA